MSEPISDSPITVRLKDYINTTGLTISQFADKAGIPRPTLSQLLTGRNKTINNQLLSKLDEAFPDLDIVWLLFGRGTLRNKANIETSEPQNASTEPHLEAYTPAQEPIKPTATENTVQHSAQSNYVSEPQWRASVICTPSEQHEQNVSHEIKSDDKEVPSPTPKQRARRITNIIIFYSDNSFETFKPSDC